MKAYGIVATPVTSLRRRPLDAAEADRHDEGQESQLLYNEVLLVTDETEDWLRVEALEQRKFLGPEGWGGYPGWVRRRDVARVEEPPIYNGLIRAAYATVAARPSADAPVLSYLSMGTKLLLRGEKKGFFEVSLACDRVGWVPKKDATTLPSPVSTGRRAGQELADLARLFLGVPYLWGGRSMPLPASTVAAGVDCSGLVNLVFRTLGTEVPRDAHDQWLAAGRILARDLRAGDLVFLSKEGRPDSIDHVVLSLGGELFIEAPQTGGTVVARSFSDRVGLDLRMLGQQGFTINRRKLHFGRIER